MTPNIDDSVLVDEPICKRDCKRLVEDRASAYGAYVGSRSADVDSRYAVRGDG